MSSIAAQFATRGKKALVPSPKQCVAIGRNYAAHIKELNNTTPSEPFFFLKPTTSYALSGDGKVEIPKGVVVHHEVELGVIIGKRGRDIPASKALDYVAGYTLAIDYTARNVQDAVKAKGLPWSAAKGFDTFCPVGQFIPKDKVQDPHNLRLWYKINGEAKQDDSTSLMLYRIPDLIAHVSGIMTLEEGDLLLTGTPKGVGPVVAGDSVTAGLETQDGSVLDQLQHLVKAREGGYEFKGKL
ncbi:fumarylacetoacetate hydrolase family protein [Rhodotorula toruloides]|uniref:Fumarylacetoacetate hydrolase family protein n=1 Tax=Rhodotorula toruloides TaxID=5286 RepID=A0A511KH54_RHOTO|nr:fumarylacetoacetate hydrolase family protein [Rhodotorula toruloides]